MVLSMVVHQREVLGAKKGEVRESEGRGRERHTWEESTSKTARMVSVMASRESFLWITILCGDSGDPFGERQRERVTTTWSGEGEVDISQTYKGEKGEGEKGEGEKEERVTEDGGLSWQLEGVCLPCLCICGGEEEEEGLR